jgi:SAM-dependent methyltransferase
MLAICARRARRIPLVLANFWQPPLPFADATFGAAIALHGTLAHPPNEATVSGLVHELGRVIVRGGRFLAEVPTVAWLEAASSVPPTDERRITRTGTHTCVFEDGVARTSIETRLLEASQWRETFSPLWEARLEALSPLEWLIVAERL